MCIFVKMNPLRLLKNNIDALFAALVGMLLIIVFTTHGGVGISPDSIYYKSAADSLMKGKGFYQFDDSPLILFPLFYPSFLALVQFIFRQDVIVFAPYLNGVLFAVAIFISGCILEKINHARWLKWILLLLIVASPGLLEIYTMLWSEGLFIVEILFFIWVGLFYFNSYSIKHLLLLAILAAVAFETRLAGITIVITGGLLILLAKEIEFYKKIKHIFIFGIIACSLISVNLIRNFLLSASLTGTRQKGETPFAENVKHFGNVLIDWLPFSSSTKDYPFWTGLIFLLIISIIFIYRLSKNNQHSSLEKIANTFTLVYALFMLLSATFSKYETINNRLLAPFFIPCLFTLSFYLTGWFKLIRRPLLKISFLLFSILIGVATLLQYYKIDLDTYQENKEGGIGGYTDDDWVNSETLGFIKKDRTIFQKRMPVYSNSSHAVYFYTGEHLSILPEKAHKKDLVKFNNLPQFVLIWLNNEDNESIITLEAIKQQQNLTILKEFKDGFIFQCSPK